MKELELSTNKEADLPENTQYVSGNPFEGGVKKVMLPMPKKIKDRLKLNQMGLNGLATTIVTPEVAQDIDMYFLNQVLQFSNDVNLKIGLPNSDDLIIRTSSVKSTRKYSEPALLIKRLRSSNPQFELLSEDGDTTLPNLNDFLSSLKSETYLLIHDDNYSMQTRSLHGRIGQNIGNPELVIASEVLHTRRLGENDPKYPFITIRSDHLESYGSINLYQIGKYFCNDSDIITPRTQISFRNCDQSKALRMLAKLKRDYLMLMGIVNRATSEFGESSVVEFRSYDLLEGGIGRKIHALDVNY